MPGVAPAFQQTSAPAVSLAASASQGAAGAGVSNVLEGFSFGFSATNALGSIQTVTVNLRDGATGVGTILKTWQFTLPAAVIPQFFVERSGLKMKGSGNTALTLEFAGAITNLLTFVNMDGYTAPT